MNALYCYKGLLFIYRSSFRRNLPDYPFIQKFYGAALLKEGKEVRGILVLEFCKENLRRHIFLNPENISGVSTDPATRTKVIRWAGNIANALKFLHEQGIFHMNLKLENVLVIASLACFLACFLVNMFSQANVQLTFQRLYTTLGDPCSQLTL